MIDAVTLRAQRDLIMKQRDDYVAQANNQIGFFNGEIAIIDQVLNQLEAEALPGAGRSLGGGAETDTTF